MTNSKYELVIFDCDGTLVDSENVIAFACSEVLKDFGYLDYNLEKCLKLFHAHSIKDSINYFLNKDLNFPVSEFVEASNNKVISLYQNGGIHAYDDTHHILQYLRNNKIKMCVASNGMQPVVRNALIKTDLIKYFEDDKIFTYDMIDVAKPEPDLFLYSAEHFNIDPSKCLVIEDSAIGVEAANRANMDVLLIERMETGRVIPGKILQNIKSMNEIKNYFGSVDLNI